MKTTETKRIRILLADDHLVVRTGLSALLGIEPDLEVVGEAADGEEAVRCAKALRPDVVIMDLMMPRMNGVAATTALRSELPDAKVLVLTTFGDSANVRRALDAGATSALIKDASRAELVGAIRRTAAGTRVVSREMRATVMLDEPPPALSPRHVEILALVAKGLNNRDIARVLGIGRDCVKAHLKTTFARLGVASRAEAVAIAIRRSLLKA